MIWGIVLAAGLSRRMGAPKQLLPLEGKPLLAHVLGAASASSLSGLVIVVSPALWRWADFEQYPGAVVVLNPAPESGQSQSLRLGLEAVPDDAQGVLVLMSDQPGIGARLIDYLIDEFERVPTDALVPTYLGERGSPVLLGRSLLPAAATLSGDTGARSLLRDLGVRVRTVEVGHLGSPDDVDTPEEYERILQRARTS